MPAISEFETCAVFGDQNTSGGYLAEMRQHAGAHMRDHDPPGIEIRETGLQGPPIDMTGNVAQIGIAFRNVEIGLIRDL